MDMGRCESLGRDETVEVMVSVPDSEVSIEDEVEDGEEARS